MEACALMTTKLSLICIFFVAFQIFSCSCELDELKQSDGGQRYKLEGKVIVQSAAENWMSTARILVDGGQYLGLLKPDGSFTISVPSGSYVVEVTHPTYLFEPARVEINSKGKIRVRSLNNIQPSAVHTLNYPLRFKSRGIAQYFEKREQWRLTDFLFSPMIMMMFFPLILMFILPKLMNSQDPETQREMQQSMSMLQPQQNMPDAAELLTKWFGGGSSDKKAVKSSKASKKQQ